MPDLLAQIEDTLRRGVTCLGLFGAHPTRLRYTTFWDVLNFNRGQKTPETEYRYAPRRTDAEYASALRNLRRMVAAVRGLPGVEIISTRRLNSLFAAEGGPVASAVVSAAGVGEFVSLESA